MVTLDEDLRARLPVWGWVVAGAYREVNLALVSKLLGVNLRTKLSYCRPRLFDEKVLGCMRESTKVPRDSSESWNYGQGGANLY